MVTKCLLREQIKIWKGDSATTESIDISGEIDYNETLFFKNREVNKGGPPRDLGDSIKASPMKDSSSSDKSDNI